MKSTSRTERVKHIRTERSAVTRQRQAIFTMRAENTARTEKTSGADSVSVRNWRIRQRFVGRRRTTAGWRTPF